MQREAEEEQSAITKKSSPTPQISTPLTPTEEPGLLDKVGHALFGWLGMGKEDKNKKEEEQERQRQEAIPPPPHQPKPPLPDVDWSLLDGEWDDFEWRKPTPLLKPHHDSMREMEAKMEHKVQPPQAVASSQQVDVASQTNISPPKPADVPVPQSRMRMR